MSNKIVGGTDFFRCSSFVRLFFSLSPSKLNNMQMSFSFPMWNNHSALSTLYESAEENAKKEIEFLVIYTTENNQIYVFGLFVVCQFWFVRDDRIQR